MAARACGRGQRRPRRYRPGTLILETDFETPEGAVRVIDFMPHRDDRAPQLIRIVEGLRGRVPMQMRLSLRPDYGAIVPWLELAPGGIGPAGPGRLPAQHAAPAAHRGRDGEHRVHRDRRRTRTFRAQLASVREGGPPVEDADSALARTDAAWREWSDRCTYDGEYRDDVLRSLITLKAMTNEVTGALVAAPTTSLPEDIGGVRNWDYRYCWLRDSALALGALFGGGYLEEASAFRNYLLRAATGDPSKLQIMYGIGGERRLTEFELDEFPGYEGSKPVRVGNAASDQFQLDVYGELAVVSHIARSSAPQLGVHHPSSRRSNGDAGWGWSNTWRASGASPTRASGRCGGRGVTSPSRR